METKKQRFYYVFSSDDDEEQSTTTATISEVGGKALSLIETCAANFPVPSGLVLTVTFFESWLREVVETVEWKDFLHANTRENCEAVKACCKDLKLDAVQHGQLERAIQRAFGGGTSLSNLGIVAVRSSSPEEDLARSSFAGGYATTLGVTSDTLQSALIESFSSMFDHQVVLYKSKHGIPTNTPPCMAVIIQRQIDSDVSGVGFSINPSNNCYDEIMISAGFGLGESVVGGTITPDTFVVDRFEKEPKIVSKVVAEKHTAIWLGGGKARDGNGVDSSGTISASRRGGTHRQVNPNPLAQTLTDEQIFEVADLVARVEERRGDGTPVDIEFTYVDNKLYLLQARPVTTHLSLYPEMVTKRGEERRLYLDFVVMTQGFDEHLSVLGLDLWRRRLDVWDLNRTKGAATTSSASSLVWNLHGRQYVNLSNTMKVPHMGRFLTGKILRSVDSTIGRAFDTVNAHDYVPSTAPSGSRGFWRMLLSILWLMVPKIIKGLFKGDESMDSYIRGADAVIRRCQEDKCSADESLEDVMDSLCEDVQKFIPGIGGLSAGGIALKRLRKMFSRCEGAEDLLTCLCMDLHGNPTSEMGHLMANIASSPQFQETESGEEFVLKLRQGSYSDEFMAIYNEFLTKYGCRGIKEIDVSVPRMCEDELGLFDKLKRIDPEDNRITDVKERRNKAYDELLVMAKEIGKERQFKHCAHLVQRLLGYREHPRYMLVVMLSRMRRHALSVGKKLVSQGRLENVDQIFSLTASQIDEAQANQDMDLLSLIETNTGPIKKTQHVKNWPVLIDSRGRIIREIRQDEDVEDGTLLGNPISPGVVSGKAKVLFSPYEKPILSGEILVTHSTEPSWTPLFINAAAVVLEVGGPVQHGAIIAREYGIPCVSGLATATTMIKDGDFIEVDGSTGSVTIIESSGSIGTATTATVGDSYEDSDEDASDRSMYDDL